MKETKPTQSSRNPQWFVTSSQRCAASMNLVASEAKIPDRLQTGENGDWK
jgi:hypothetical protein